MPEKIEELVRAAISAAQEAGELPEFEVGDLGFERPADPSNGDWSSTVAMRSAKLARRAPRQIADAIVSRLPEDPSVDRVEVAGPGFINFYLATASANEVFRTVREQGADYARSSMGAGTKVQVEFVSANPVGPLHIGHGRWVAIGDSLCRVLEHVGYDVEREYYVNDHGSQMDVFGHSISMRYQQLLSVMGERGASLEDAREVLLADREAFVADEGDERPETHPLTDAFNEALGGNAYGGDYIVDIAVHAAKAAGHRVIAVGTTSVRSLESAWEPGAAPSEPPVAARRFEGAAGVGDIVARENATTNLYLMPGSHFHVVDAMITNFHVPRSTLMMLVSAFATRDQIMAAYNAAIDERYRFLSFGDAMLIE